MIAEPIDPGMLGKDMPLLEKLTVHLLEDKPGTLDVTLTVPLDKRPPTSAPPSSSSRRTTRRSTCDTSSR